MKNFTCAGPSQQATNGDHKAQVPVTHGDILRPEQLAWHLWQERGPVPVVEPEYQRERYLARIVLEQQFENSREDDSNSHRAQNGRNLI